MFYWSFTSLVHFWPPPIFNPGYAYDTDFVMCFNYCFSEECQWPILALCLKQIKYSMQCWLGARLPLPALGRDTSIVYDARPTSQLQRMTALPFGGTKLYCLVTCMWTTVPMLAAWKPAGAPGIEPVTCWLRVQLANHHTSPQMTKTGRTGVHVPLQ